MNFSYIHFLRVASSSLEIYHRIIQFFPCFSFSRLALDFQYNLTTVLLVRFIHSFVLFTSLSRVIFTVSLYLVYTHAEQTSGRFFFPPFFFHFFGELIFGVSKWRAEDSTIDQTLLVCQIYLSVPYSKSYEILCHVSQRFDFDLYIIFSNATKWRRVESETTQRLVFSASRFYQITHRDTNDDRCPGRILLSVVIRTLCLFPFSPYVAYSSPEIISCATRGGHRS